MLKGSNYFTDFEFTMTRFFEEHRARQDPSGLWQQFDSSIKSFQGFFPSFRLNRNNHRAGNDSRQPTSLIRCNARPTSIVQLSRGRSLQASFHHPSLHFFFVQLMGLFGPLRGKGNFLFRIFIFFQIPCSLFLQFGADIEPVASFLSIFVSSPSRVQEVSKVGPSINRSISGCFTIPVQGFGLTLFHSNTNTMCITKLILSITNTLYCSLEGLLLYDLFKIRNFSKYFQSFLWIFWQYRSSTQVHHSNIKHSFRTT
jgi:hypothetical protein